MAIVIKNKKIPKEEGYYLCKKEGYTVPELTLITKDKFEEGVMHYQGGISCFPLNKQHTKGLKRLWSKRLDIEIKES